MASNTKCINSNEPQNHKTEKKHEEITKLNFTFIDLRHSFNSNEILQIVIQYIKQKYSEAHSVPELIYWTRSYFGIESKFISCAIRASPLFLFFFFALQLLHTTKGNLYDEEPQPNRTEMINLINRCATRT